MSKMQSQGKCLQVMKPVRSVHKGCRGNHTLLCWRLHENSRVVFYTGDTVIVRKGKHTSGTVALLLRSVAKKAWLNCVTCRAFGQGVRVLSQYTTWATPCSLKASAAGHSARLRKGPLHKMRKFSLIKAHCGRNVKSGVAEQNSHHALQSQSHQSTQHQSPVHQG